LCTEERGSVPFLDITPICDDGEGQVEFVGLSIDISPNGVRGMLLDFNTISGEKQLCTSNPTVGGRQESPNLIFLIT
jgi:hypothetical protein